jgi:hypothetical protein
MDGQHKTHLVAETMTQQQVIRKRYPPYTSFSSSQVIPCNFCGVVLLVNECTDHLIRCLSSKKTKNSLAVARTVYCLYICGIIPNLIRDLDGAAIIHYYSINTILSFYRYLYNLRAKSNILRIPEYLYEKDCNYIKILDIVINSIDVTVIEIRLVPGLEVKDFKSVDVDISKLFNPYICALLTKKPTESILERLLKM